MAAVLHDPAVPQSADREVTAGRKVNSGPVERTTARIAARVEELRGLPFERVPEPRVLTLPGLKRLSEREARRTGAIEDLREDEQTLQLLGLIEPTEDLEGVADAIAEDVAGAYDSRRDRLYVIRGSTPEESPLDEVVLAHELTHALEDQRFGLPEPDEVPGDGGLAALALVEGTATALMVEYATTEGLVGSFLDATVDSAAYARIPDFVEAQLFFTYLRGATFVGTLREAGDDWDLVDLAHRSRPPLSTEQILHPQKYLSYERPLAVRVDAGRVLDGDWQEVDADDVGEFDTFKLLELGVGEAAARRAAAGWGGGRFELWRRPGPGPCPPPCRSRALILVGWRWDTAPDARQFSRALRTYIEEGLGGSEAATGVWSVDDGWAATASGLTRTTLALGPSPELTVAAATLRP